MKKISSGSLFIAKKIFPLIWLGFIALFLYKSLAIGPANKNVVLIFAPCVMTMFGFIMMKKMVWELVDEAYDCGDHLLFKNGKQEDKVFLSDIMNVSATFMLNPQRITLRLRKPSKFGTEVSFTPAKQFSLNPFQKNQIVEDLIVRVDEARMKRII